MNSCAANYTLPDIGIPIEELNKDFELVAPDPWNSFKIGDPVMIDVTLISDRIISFPNNFGARAFVEQEGEWVELENMFEFMPGRFILSPSEDFWLKSGTAGFLPKLDDIEKSVKLVIIVTGNVMDKKEITDELVGGYLEVELRP